MNRYFKRILQSASFFKGLSVTLKYFFQPKRIVTEQYPENRDTLRMYSRFRGRLEMIEDENGENKCTACGMCERNCPNGSISVLPTKNIAGKKFSGVIFIGWTPARNADFASKVAHLARFA